MLDFTTFRTLRGNGQGKSALRKFVLTASAEQLVTLRRVVISPSLDLAPFKSAIRNLRSVLAEEGVLNPA